MLWSFGRVACVVTLAAGISEVFADIEKRDTSEF